MRVLIDYKTFKSLFADVYNDKTNLVTKIQNRDNIEVENEIDMIKNMKWL